MRSVFILVAVFTFDGCACRASHVVPSPMRGCCVGEHITFGLEPSFAHLTGMFMMPENNTGPQIFLPGSLSGYLPALIDALSLEMGFTYTIVIDSGGNLFWRTLAPSNVPSAQDPSILGGTMDFYLSEESPQLCGQTPSFNCLPDLLHSSTSPSQYIVATKTASVHVEHTVGIVKRSVKPPSWWAFLQPFSMGTWISIVCLVLLTAGMMYTLDRLATMAEPSDGLTPLVNVADVLYHALAVALGGDEREWRTWPARLLRLSLLFCFLVLVSAYTANLAAFFVAPSVVMSGPKSMEELERSTVCLFNTFPVGSPTPVEKALYYSSKVVGVDKQLWLANTGSINQTVIDEGQQFCREAIQSGAADVWITAAVQARAETLANCETTALTDFMQIESAPYMFLANGLNPRSLHLTANLSKAILAFASTPASLDLKRTHLNEGVTCAGQRSSNDDALQAITVNELAGLYLVCGVTAVIGCCLAAYLECRRRQTAQQGQDVDDVTSMLEVPSQRLSRWSSPAHRRSKGADVPDGEKLTELLALVRKLEGAGPNAAAAQAGLTVAKI